MTRPLVIDEEKLQELRELAEDIPILEDELRAIADGNAKPPGDFPEHVCNLDFGYKVVFSVEEHPQEDRSTKWLRHMSASVDEKGRAPNPIAMAEIGRHLGFPCESNGRTPEIRLDMAKCQVWIEELSEGHSAVNVVCPYEQDEK